MDFIKEVISWYSKNKRDLPWRNTSDPYIIWLSEVILQQTRVEQGLPYFHRFSEAFPTVSDFAAASEDEILQLWQGLGYYSRGRNMHKAAQVVMEEHGGYFPKKYNDLIKLRGIGEYTAAAISSFAGNEANAVVDGNVFRLLARYYGISEPINSLKGKKTFTELANQLIDRQSPGISNQAIMEFGSIVCRPKNPDCSNCPLAISCEALKTGTIQNLPVKLKSNKSMDRYFNYLVAIDNGKILLKKRLKKDIWHSLHDFPLIESTNNFNKKELLGREDVKKYFGEDIKISQTFGPFKHVLSHQNIYAKFFCIENFTDDYKTHQQWIAVDLQNLNQYAQPKLIFAFLERYF